MVVGVLTAKRTPSTVVRMVDALVSDVSLTDYEVLVRVGQSASNNTRLIQDLRNLGVTTIVNTRNYPEMSKDKVRITCNDSLLRVLWRTEHGMKNVKNTCTCILCIYNNYYVVLDYANLLTKTLEIDSEYVFILEDDLKPAKNALEKSYEFAKLLSKRQDTANWAVTFYSTGVCKKEFITKAAKFTAGGCSIMLKRSIIPHFLDYILKGSIRTSN